MIQGTVQFRLFSLPDGAHGTFQHLGVEGEAHFVDLAALVFSQQFTGATDLQIMGGQGEAGAQVFQCLQGFQALERVLCHGTRRRSDEIGVGAVVRAAHAAAQLVELGQPQLVGAVDDDGVGAGHVDAALDDGGGHQDVETLVVEVAHDALQFALAHLPVDELHPRAGHQVADGVGHLLNAAHLVVQHVHLAAACQLALNRLAHQHVVPLVDEGLDGVAARRRGGDDGEIAHAGHGHVEGARDGRGGEGENVHLGTQGLEPLLVAHAEAVFLVHDHQPQVLEFHLLAEQFVGAHHDVHGAFGQPLQGGCRLLAVAEARERGDLHRPVGEAVGKVVVVLLGQQGGGHQHRHLLAASSGEEGGAHGHLGLAEAHVAAHHPVHGLGGGHVADHIVDGCLLVGGLLELELGGELAVVVARRRKGEPLAGGAARVDLQQFGGGIAHLLRCTLPGLLPLVAAQAVQGSGLLGAAGVAADEIKGRDRHVELVTTVVLDGEEFLCHAAHVQALQAQVAAHAVFLVDHRCAFLQLGQVAHHLVGVAGPAALAFLAYPLAQQQALGYQGEGGGFQPQALFDGGCGDGEALFLFEETGPALHRPGCKAEPGQGLHEMFPAARAVGKEEHPAFEAVEKILQQARRSRGAGLDTQGRQGAGGKIDGGPVALGAFFAAAPAPGDTGERVEAAGQFIVTKIEIGRWQQGTFDIVAALLVAFAHLPEELLRLFAHPFTLDHQGVLGQVLEEGGRVFMEQRQVVLDPPRQSPLAHLPVDEAGLGVPFEAVAPVAPEAGDGFLVDGKLPRRKQADGLYLLDGTLGLGIEGADAVDLVVEEVDAVGYLAAHGIEVEQRTAHGELPVSHHLGDALVAGAFQPLAEGVDLQPLPCLQDQGVKFQVARWQDALLQGGRRYHQNAAACLLQAVQGKQPLGDQLRQG